MPSVFFRPSEHPAVGQFVILSDETADSRVEIAPERGAIVTSFKVKERELLYLEAATLFDGAKNVRGGIPVLFPSPGKLEEDAFRQGGKSGTLRQHDFARNLEWTLKSTSEDAVGAGPGAGRKAEPSVSDRAAVTVSLTSNETTLRQYPWSFEAELRFSLRGRCLRIDQMVRNTGDSAMPFAIGFHPYFVVGDKMAARIDTRATRAFDNVSKSVQPFTGFDLTLPEVDLHLLDHGSAASALHFADGARVDVRASAEFNRWVVWTLAGKDFVCLEPWTAPGNALNTGEHLLVVPPGSARELFVEMEFVAA